jgi:hypothetical protein
MNGYHNAPLVGMMMVGGPTDSSSGLQELRAWANVVIEYEYTHSLLNFFLENTDTAFASKV